MESIVKGFFPEYSETEKIGLPLKKEIPDWGGKTLAKNTAQTLAEFILQVQEQGKRLLDDPRLFKPITRPNGRSMQEVEVAYRGMLRAFRGYTTPRYFSSQLCAQRPEFAEHPQIVKFLAFLTLRAKTCPFTGGKIIGRDLLSTVFGIPRKQFRLYEFLHEAQETVLPGLKITEHSYTRELSVTVLETGLEHLLEQIERPLNTPEPLLRSKGLSRKQRREAARAEKVLRKQAAVGKYAGQIAYMNEVKGKWFHVAPQNKWRANLQAILLDQQAEKERQAREKKAGCSGSGERCDHQNALDVVLAGNIGIYHTVSHSDRIFGGALCNLKTELRHLCYPDWVDYDVRSCHLVLLAHVLDLPLCKEFVKSGFSLWEAIFDVLEVSQEDRIEEVKQILKHNVVYPLCYGKQFSAMLGDFRKSMKEAGVKHNDRLRSLPLFKELTAAIEEKLREITAAGGMLDATGGWIACTLENPARKVLGQVIQSYEVKFVIVPVIDQARKDKRNHHMEYELVLIQHDGFTLAPKKNFDAEKLLKKFQGVIRRASKGMSWEQDLVLVMKKTPVDPERDQRIEQLDLMFIKDGRKHMAQPEETAAPGRETPLVVSTYPTNTPVNPGLESSPGFDQVGSNVRVFSPGAETPTPPQEETPPLDLERKAAFEHLREQVFERKYRVLLKKSFPWEPERKTYALTETYLPTWQQRYDFLRETLPDLKAADPLKFEIAALLELLPDEEKEIFLELDLDQVTYKGIKAWVKKMGYEKEEPESSPAGEEVVAFWRNLGIVQE